MVVREYTSFELKVDFANYHHLFRLIAMKSVGILPPPLLLNANEQATMPYPEAPNPACA